MQLAELAKNGSRLERIKCSHDVDVAGMGGFSSVVFEFEGALDLTLAVNANTDELIWSRTNDGPLIDLRDILPSAGDAYGLSLAWSWEMKNHQGYFDAVQLEFVDLTLAKNVTLQFKAAASVIWVFRVQHM